MGNMTTPYDCMYECEYSDFCRHTEEYYCEIDGSPCFMAYHRFYNDETGECLKKKKRKLVSSEEQPQP